MQYYFIDVESSSHLCMPVGTSNTFYFLILYKLVWDELKFSNMVNEDSSNRPQLLLLLLKNLQLCGSNLSSVLDDVNSFRLNQSTFKVVLWHI